MTWPAFNMTHPFLHCHVDEIFVWATPDSQMSVVLAQTEADHVTEDDICPLVSCPLHMTSVESLTCYPVWLGKAWSSIWTPRTELTFMRTTLNRLLTKCVVSSRSLLTSEAADRGGSCLQRLSLDLPISLSCVCFGRSDPGSLFDIS